MGFRGLFDCHTPFWPVPSVWWELENLEFCYNLPFLCLHHLVSSHLVALFHLITSSPHHLVTSPPHHLFTHITTTPHHLVISSYSITQTPYHSIALSLYHSVTSISSLPRPCPCPRIDLFLVSVYPWVFPLLDTVLFPSDPRSLSTSILILMYHQYLSLHLHPHSKPLVSPFILVSTCSLILDHVLSVFFSHHGHPSPGSLIIPYLCFPSCTYTAWSVPISPLVLIPSHL